MGQTLAVDVTQIHPFQAVSDALIWIQFRRVGQPGPKRSRLTGIIVFMVLAVAIYYLVLAKTIFRPHLDMLITPTTPLACTADRAKPTLF